MIRKFAKGSLIACLLVWLSATGLGCGDKTVSGKYNAPGGASLEFVSDQLVKVTDPTGKTVSDHYMIDGSTITVHDATGDVPFTLMSDGTIQGMNMTFTKAQ
jgi:hypothetical protein